MAQENKTSNPSQAWANFAASGRVDDYLAYRDAVNKASAVSGAITQQTNQGGAPYAKPTERRSGSGRKKRGGKGSPGHGAF